MVFMKLVFVVLVFVLANISIAYAQSASEWISKGEKLEENLKYDEAVECYNKAIAADLFNVAAWSNKGRIFEKQNLYEEAIKCYDKVLTVEKDSYQALHSKGKILFTLRKYKEALSCYDKALEINPKDKELKKDIRLVQNTIEQSTVSYKVKAFFTNKDNILFMTIGFIVLLFVAYFIYKAAQGAQSRMLGLQIMVDPSPLKMGDMMNVAIHVKPWKEVEVIGYWTEIKCVRYYTERRYDHKEKRYKTVNRTQTLAKETGVVKVERVLAPNKADALGLQMIVPYGSPSSGSSMWSRDRRAWTLTVGVEIPKAIDAQKTVDIIVL